MKPTAYFDNESPDFNFMLENGKNERMAENKVAICTITEFGLCNDREMSKEEFSNFIASIQMTTGTKKYDRKKESIVSFIESIRLPTLIDSIARGITSK